MKELRDIATAYRRSVKEGKRTALATVVDVEGSSYRRPGARMLVTEDGEITGAISGGCLEGDALRKAWLAIHQQQNKLVIYDTTDEDDAKFGVQLGCNGIVSILFEPIDPGFSHNPMKLIDQLLNEREPHVLVTQFGRRNALTHAGTTMLISTTGAVNFTGDDGERLTSEGKSVLTQGISEIKAYQEFSVLYQVVPPSLNLIIFGAGNDAQPLVRMASLIGWEVTVVDGRATHATRDRFPDAQEVVVAKPDEVFVKLHPDEQTAMVLMTHNYNYDLAVLEKSLHQSAAYIGVLGPRKKLERMFDELSAKGLVLTNEQLLRVHGPVGLDIGAEGADEIALSILAEIKSVLTGRNGGPLKFRQETIYERK